MGGEYKRREGVAHYHTSLMGGEYKRREGVAHGYTTLMGFEYIRSEGVVNWTTTDMIGTKGEGATFWRYLKKEWCEEHSTVGWSDIEIYCYFRKRALCCRLGIFL